MLQEIDELDQFRITVQQLEVCRSLILKDGEAHCRSALILLDHIRSDFVSDYAGGVRKGRIHSKGASATLCNQEKT